MKLIDAHCHLQDPRIFTAHGSIVRRAEHAGVKYMVSCSTHEQDWTDTRNLSLIHDSVIPCYGIHPWFAASSSIDFKEKLKAFLQAEISRVKKKFTPGLGEAGLDFAIKKPDRALQEKIFTDQLALAKEIKLPISIHIRKAWDLFIHIIKKIGPLPGKGLIHSYSGSPDMIPLFEKYGLYISFSGSITYKGAKKVIKSLNAVSCDRILIETDSPDITPNMVCNGKKNILNRPENLVFIADIASQIRKITVKEIAALTCKNGLRLFNVSG